MKITDYIVKYKRYIGAGVLVLALVIILVFCINKSNGDSDTQDSTSGAAETTGYALDVDLQKDADPELTELIQDYYKAYAGADLETLEMLAQPFDDNEKSYVGSFSDYYEEFQNIECYSTQGATEDSYLVSVCYDLKFYEVDTPAPGMDFFYVERDGKGNLVINNVYSAYNFNFSEQEMDANLYAMIVAYEKSDEVAALQNQVQARYDEAVASDENLANMVGGTLRDVMAKWRDSVAAEDAQNTEETQTTEETETTEDTQKEDESQTTEDTPKEDESQTAEDEDTTDDPVMVKTKDVCNVRKEPSTDAEALGMVTAGVKFEKLGTEGDWTKVEFRGEIGYIRSDLLKTVKKKN
jgi:hypothetical protein